MDYFQSPQYDQPLGIHMGRLICIDRRTVSPPRKPGFARLFPSFLFFLLPAISTAVRADAIIVTKAMTASTVAEIFIEKDNVRLELEIGYRDFKAFRNLFADPIYEKLGYAPEPLARRLDRFFRSDFTLRADGGPPMGGRVDQVQARGRIRRDEVTGDPLPVQPEDAEMVFYVRILYPLARAPAVLSIRPPMNENGTFPLANIGFVAYHGGLAINDFRYLSGEELLDLDGSDPWYSRFRNRILWRQYDSPTSVYLYVDHYEVRKEVIVRPRDLQPYVDLGLTGKATIAVAEQEEIKKRVVAFLAPRAPVLIDGKPVAPIPDRVNFIRRSLRTTGVIDPPEDLPAVSATMGVIFYYPIAGLPRKVTMKWDLFSERIRTIPGATTDEAGGLPLLITPERPVLEWNNFLTHPSLPGLVPVSRPDRNLPVSLLSLGCLLVALGMAVWVYLDTRTMRSLLWLLPAGMLLAGFLFWPFVQVPVPAPGVLRPALSDRQAGEILAALLKNIYRAFDYREERVIYDALAASVSGDLLTRTYLETHQALLLQNQGGARAKVQDVQILKSKATALRGEPGFAVECSWVVNGAVGHWGHIHFRRNRYEAMVSVHEEDGSWKITHLEVLHEQRL